MMHVDRTGHTNISFSYVYFLFLIFMLFERFVCFDDLMLFSLDAQTDHTGTDEP